MKTLLKPRLLVLLFILFSAGSGNALAAFPIKKTVQQLEQEQTILPERKKIEPAQPEYGGWLSITSIAAIVPAYIMLLAYMFNGNYMVGLLGILLFALSLVCGIIGLKKGKKKKLALLGVILSAVWSILMLASLAGNLPS